MLDFFMLDFFIWDFSDFIFFGKVEKYMRFAMVLQNGLLGKNAFSVIFVRF